MKGWEKLMLWVSFVGFVLLAILFFTQKPSTHVTELSDQVSTIETRVETAESDLQQGKLWADSMQAWAEQMHVWAYGVWNALRNTAPGDDIICPACLDSDTEEPPGNKPCKPGQC